MSRTANLKADQTEDGRGWIEILDKRMLVTLRGKTGWREVEIGRGSSDSTLDEDRTFISIVTIAEIRRGVALMDSGRKRDNLGEWLEHNLPQRFENRIIPVEGPVALAWGDLMASPSEVVAGWPLWTA